MNPTVECTNLGAFKYLEKHYDVSKDRPAKRVCRSKVNLWEKSLTASWATRLPVGFKIKAGSPNQS
jgi:hypothetical protein